MGYFWANDKLLECRIIVVLQTKKIRVSAVNGWMCKIWMVSKTLIGQKTSISHWVYVCPLLSTQQDSTNWWQCFQGSLFNNNKKRCIQNFFCMCDIFALWTLWTMFELYLIPHQFNPAPPPTSPFFKI